MMFTFFADDASCEVAVSLHRRILLSQPTVTADGYTIHAEKQLNIIF